MFGSKDNSSIACVAHSLSLFLAPFYFVTHVRSNFVALRTRDRWWFDSLLSFVECSWTKEMCGCDSVLCEKCVFVGGNACYVCFMYRAKNGSWSEKVVEKTCSNGTHLFVSVVDRERNGSWSGKKRQRNGQKRLAKIPGNFPDKCWLSTVCFGVHSIHSNIPATHFGKTLLCRTFLSGVRDMEQFPGISRTNVG